MRFWPDRHQNRGWLGLTVSMLLWGVAVALATDCSHNSPYVKEPKVETPVAATASPSYRLLLLGDGGFALPGSSVMDALAKRAAEDPEHTSVVFLGDNIYPAGLPEPGHEERQDAERHLLAQIEPLRGLDLEVIFVPGNHDWSNSGIDGAVALRRQQEFLANHGTRRTRLLPSDGHPGPVCLDRGDLRLALIDTQWWLHRYERRTDISREQVLADLRGCVESAGPRHVVVAAHHPLITHGPHGGFIDWVDHVFPLTRVHPLAYVPLPIIGSLYPLVRSAGVTTQDTRHEDNLSMVNQLTAQFQHRRPLLYAAGHDHSLQVQQMGRGPRFHVVSGGGSRPSSVTHDDSTLFAVAQLGFMELDLHGGGRPLLRVYTLEDDEASVAWQRWLE